MALYIFRSHCSANGSISIGCVPYGSHSTCRICAFTVCPSFHGNRDTAFSVTLTCEGLSLLDSSVWASVFSVRAAPRTSWSRSPTTPGSPPTVKRQRWAGWRPSVSRWKSRSVSRISGGLCGVPRPLPRQPPSLCVLSARSKNHKERGIPYRIRQKPWGFPVDLPPMTLCCWTEGVAPESFFTIVVTHDWLPAAVTYFILARWLVATGIVVFTRKYPTSF